MGREFELKYAATPENLAFLKAKYPHLRPIVMETTYYDDPDGMMSRMHWTLRRRMENEISVCSLKTPAGGLLRGEWETECDDILESIPTLCAMGAPAQLAELTGKGLRSVCGARFVRLAGLIEVEVELKSGSEAAAVAFGTALAEELGLKEELRSKVGRARALAGI